MYIIIWEYHVREESLPAFQTAYASNGTWTQLFQHARGFLGTDLLRDENNIHRYITIDRWTSSQDYENFLCAWREEYEALDMLCEELTEEERLIGKGDILHHG